MEQRDIMEKLSLTPDSIFTAAQARAAGIHSEYLTNMVKSGELEKVAYGIYAFSEELYDELYTLQRRKDKVIYSHETALYLHDLTDREPFVLSVTVPTGYHSHTLFRDSICVHNIRKDLLFMGITELKTTWGNPVKVYDMERTLCDMVKDKKNQDIAVVTDALKRYVKRKDKNLKNLMEYAGKLKVGEQMRFYMEVLI